jgi:hypothetical protein
MHKRFTTKLFKYLTTGLAGLEPSTYRLGGDRSIQLSYSPRINTLIIGHSLWILQITLSQMRLNETIGDALDSG